MSYSKLFKCFILKILDNYLKQKNITLNTAIELENVESVKRAVINNLGISFLPKFTVEKELRQGLLQEIEMDIDDGYMTAICAYQKCKWQSPAMKLFLELILKYFHL